jgi:hypothetical protein
VATARRRKVDDEIVRANSTRDCSHVCCGIKQDVVSALIVDASNYNNIAFAVPATTLTMPNIANATIKLFRDLYRDIESSLPPR